MSLVSNFRQSQTDLYRRDRARGGDAVRLGQGREAVLERAVVVRVVRAVVRGGGRPRRRRRGGGGGRPRRRRRGGGRLGPAARGHVRRDVRVAPRYSSSPRRTRDRRRRRCRRQRGRRGERGGRRRSRREKRRGPSWRRHRRQDWRRRGGRRWRCRGRCRGERARRGSRCAQRHGRLPPFSAHELRRVVPLDGDHRAVSREPERLARRAGHALEAPAPRSEADEERRDATALPKPVEQGDLAGPLRARGDLEHGRQARVRASEKQSA